MELSPGKREWQRIVATVGIRADTSSLPFSTACPLCHAGRLTLYHDTLSPVPVFSCAKCKKTGDLLDMIGVIRGCDRKTVIDKLRDGGVVSSEFVSRILSKDAERIARQRQALRLLDEESKRDARLLAHVGGMTLLDRLRVRRDSGMSWSDEGLPRLLGVIERSVADAFMSGRTDTEAIRNMGRTPRRIRLPYEHLLTLPFYDAPGNVSSVMLIGARTNGKFESELVKMKLPPEWPVPLGTSQHPDTPGSVGRPLVMTTDVELFIHMHAKSFTLHREPLPLACFHEHESHSVTWQHFAGREIVILATELTPRILWKAIRHDAAICFSGPIVRTPYEYVAEREPVEMISKYRQEAIPWQTALLRVARTKSDNDLCQWLSAMELSEEEQQMLLEVAPIELAASIEKALVRDVKYKSIPTLNGYVTQRQDGWYHVKPNKGEQLITNYPFRVVSATTDGKATEYTVEVPCAAGNVRFTCDKLEFDAAPFTIVQREVIASGYGVPTFDAKWQSRAVNVAMQFHRPVANVMPRIAGYDPDRQVFSSASATLHLATGEYRVFSPPLKDMRGIGVMPAGKLSREVRKFFTSKDQRDHAAAALVVAGSWLNAINRGTAKLVCVTGPRRHEVVAKLSEELQLAPAKIDNLDSAVKDWAGHLVTSDAELMDNAYSLLTRQFKAPVVVTCGYQFAMHAALAGHLSLFTLQRRNAGSTNQPAVSGRAVFRTLAYSSRYSRNLFREPHQSCAAATKDLAKADVYRMAVDNTNAREFERKLVDSHDLTACAAVLIAGYQQKLFDIRAELKKHPEKGYLLGVEAFAAFQAQASAPLAVTPSRVDYVASPQLRQVRDKSYVAVPLELVATYTGMLQGSPAINAVSVRQPRYQG